MGPTVPLQHKRIVNPFENEVHFIKTLYVLELSELSWSLVSIHIMVYAMAT